MDSFNKLLHSLIYLLLLDSFYDTFHISFVCLFPSSSPSSLSPFIIFPSLRTTSAHVFFPYLRMLSFHTCACFLSILAHVFFPYVPLRYFFKSISNVYFANTKIYKKTNSIFKLIKTCLQIACGKLKRLSPLQNDNFSKCVI